jgi:beta-glucosidase
VPQTSGEPDATLPTTDEDRGAFARAVDAVRAGSPADGEAQRLYDMLHEHERLGLLDGDMPFWPAIRSMITEGYNRRPYVHGAVERLGIPGTRFVDGPRGCVAGHGTAFPVAMARGATWDVALEEAIGDAIGREVRAQGGNFFGGVCINLPRHPAWGRIQETYGDDPHHLGELGAALTRGTEKHTMACVKHFALNSMENARFTVDVQVDEATLHDVYLPHFKRALDDGASAVMASYNSVNGEWAGQNRDLLTGVLRDLWEWDGITATDFVWGMRDGGAALEAGMDLEEPAAQQRATHLRDQLDAGEATWASVERSGVRILATQLRSYARRTAADPGPEVMACDAHRALARDAAARAMVLLKNDDVDGAPVLPLDQDLRSIAVIGRLAVAANLGDHGSSAVRPPSHVSPVDGIRAAFPNATVTLVAEDDVAAAVDAAARADVALVVAGYTAADEGEYVGGDTMARPELFALFPPMPDGFDLFGAGAGEEDGAEDHATAAAAGGDEPVPMIMSGGMGGDRASLCLRPVDEEIITAVAAANPRTVVAIVAAGAVLTEAWRPLVPATVLMWYAGMEGGHALADVLMGRHNPSGRLPFSIPTSAEHLPFFDRDATSITYDRMYGQRLLDHLGVDAAYPHGFGLSYTSFSVEHAAVTGMGEGGPRLAVTVRNTGARDGRHVVQVYGRRRTGSYAGENLVCGFAVADVPAGESVDVVVDISLLALAAWDPDGRRRVVPAPADVTLAVGSHAHDPAAIEISLGGA